MSLFEQPSFAPVAVSLSGQATFTNTDGVRVPFGGRRHAVVVVVVVGGQTRAGQEAAAREAAAAGGDAARLEVGTRELAIVGQRGGLQRGDVVVGDLHLSDFARTPPGPPVPPGGLDFVLQWTGGPQDALNVLNLAVLGPLSTAASPDFVANPPFTVSLTPDAPASEQARATTYPRRTRTGGRISANSVGPDGLDLPFWPKAYPTGTYRIRVYDLVDAINPPPTAVDPVPYTVDVYRGTPHLATYSSTIGLLHTSPTITVPVPAPPPHPQRHTVGGRAGFPNNPARSCAGGRGEWRSGCPAKVRKGTQRFERRTALPTPWWTMPRRPDSIGLRPLLRVGLHA